jgi:hypothetical protein
MRRGVIRLPLLTARASKVMKPVTNWLTSLSCSFSRKNHDAPSCRAIIGAALLVAGSPWMPFLCRRRELGNVLRSKKRKKVAKRVEAPQANGPVVVAAAPVARKATGGSKLEGLEFQIDECLILARQLDREGLQEVIGLLRRARNAVVWMIGQ